MGTYTALYGRVVLKDEVAKVLYLPGDDIPEWRRLANCRGLSPHPDVKEFIKDHRRDFIGRGDSAYFSWPDNESDDWDAMLVEITSKGWVPHLEGFSKDINYHSLRHYDPTTRELTFFSSLKNYGGTIEIFLKILPLIATDWLLFREYETEYEACSPDRIVPQWKSPRVKVSVTDLSQTIPTPKKVTVLSASRGSQPGVIIEHGKIIPDGPFGYGFNK